MKIVMFQPAPRSTDEPPVKQAGHLLWPDVEERTLCGLAYPGVLGVPAKVTGEELHLCERCEAVVTFEGRHGVAIGDIKYTGTPPLDSRAGVWMKSRERQNRRKRLV